MKYVGAADEALRTEGAPLQAASGRAGTPSAGLGSDSGTRARIARLILENGPVTAAGLSARLGLTSAAVRRHLDNLLADGLVEARSARTYGNRGRGRPARLFAITDAGRSAFEHAYDDLATSALRFLAERAGPGAVAEFARQQITELERRYRADAGVGTARRAGTSAGGGAVGRRLRRLGLRRHRAAPGASSSASTTARWRTLPPEYPQLCEAETEAFGRLLGTPVQRLATIAHGDGVCTTHVTAPSLVHNRTTNEAGGISA